MRKLVRTVIMLATLLSAATAANAQGILPIAVEGRGGYAIPQGDWNDSDALGNGFGYGLNLRLQIMPLISVYGGWDTYNFDVEDVDNADAKDSGLHLGGQISLPLSAVTGVSPFAFAGLIYNRTEMGIESGGALRPRGAPAPTGRSFRGVRAETTTRPGRTSPSMSA